MELPENINKFLEGRPYTTDDIGMSGSEIRIYDEYVLKMGKIRTEDEEMVRMMRWLEGRLPVPEVIFYETEGETQYLLMSKIPGKMSCDPCYMEQPEKLLRLLSEGLRMLWAVDISDCPRNRDLDTELKEAEERVRQGLVDVDNTEPDTFGPEGRFSDPEELLSWLKEHRPPYEPVLSHGDFCLPNIFLENDQITGFIDLGDCGTGDKWRDIALLYRSLKHNFDGTYGGKVYADFDPDRLFEELGIEKNQEKLDYYILLDELF